MPPEMQQPQRFGRYEVTGVLGEGSMGCVYKAFDPLGQRDVAIKTLHPEYCKGSDAEEYLERFRREAQAAGALLHPNIITIFDVGENYFVMELLEGATLQQLLAKRGRLPPEEVLAILGPLGGALEYAHSRGTIHRDLKPGNIMVLPDGRPKLMDFGVAHLSSRPITAAGQSLGSPMYMAPEQIEKGRASAATDLFSFGVVAYEALTGAKPFEGESVAIAIHNVVGKDPPRPSSLVPGLPRRYDQIFARVLAKRPEARPASPTAFLRDLGYDPGAPTVIDVDNAPRSADDTMQATVLDVGSAWKRKRLPVLGLAAAVLVGAVLFALRPAPAPSAEEAAAATAGMLVWSEPAGADVVIDGEARGKSPLDARGLAPGLHHVRVSLDGHAPAELRLVLSAGAPVPLHFELRPEPTPTPAVASSSGTRAASAEPSSGRGAPSARTAARTGAAPVTPLAPPLSLPPGVFPQRVEGDLPTYPEAARKLRLEGSVTVDMVIDQEGRPQDVRIRESAGPILDAAVLDALRGWRYEPTLREGEPVRVLHRYRHHFKSS